MFLAHLCFSTARKNAEMIPIIKDGDYEIANNNRPVSLPVAVIKICERVALNQFTKYMRKKKYFTEQQKRGNRKLHLTETLNILIPDIIFESMNRKEVTAFVFLAFDSINRPIMFGILQS